MKPVIALVGRPNVGKSTLFNRLTQSRDALVADQPGLTRDRKFGEGRVGDRPYIVVDTGGLSGEAERLESMMQAQSWLAVQQADVVLFLVDAREGLSAMDETIAQQLRVAGKCVHVVVNKAEGLAPDLVSAEFHSLALGAPLVVSAAHGDGVRALMDTVLSELPQLESEPEAVDAGIKIAIVGRPNVGKSTLLNRMLGEERVVAFDQPGTTRDSIYVPFERDGQRYTLIDTAGVRRRTRVKEAIEKFSVIKTLQAIEDAHVVIMVLDARQGIGEQDASLLGFVLDTGRALVVAVNKWDGLAADQKDQIRREVDLKLPFVEFARLMFISARHGTGVGDLFDAVRSAYVAATTKFVTAELTRLLEDLVASHQPPLVRGRRIKLRYAHQGGQNPPVIVIHGNQTQYVPQTYRRYLINGFRKHFGLQGTPLRVEFRSGENPYEGRRNTLTPRQQEKRKRLLRHAKRSK